MAKKLNGPRLKEKPRLLPRDISGLKIQRNPSDREELKVFSSKELPPEREEEIKYFLSEDEAQDLWSNAIILDVRYFMYLLPDLNMREELLRCIIKTMHLEIISSRSGELSIQERSPESIKMDKEEKSRLRRSRK